MLNTIHKLERVKRAARLTEKFGDRNDGAVLTVVRARPNVLKVSDTDTDVRWVATTDGIDVDDEVVVPSGLMVSKEWLHKHAPQVKDITPSSRDSYFLNNRACFLDHQYSYEDCIGHMRRVTPKAVLGETVAWIVSVKLRADHKHTKGVMDMAREGLIGASIGFARLEGGRPTEEELAKYSKDGREPTVVSRSWEWIETSATFIPANVEAQAIGTDAMEDAKAAMLDEMVSKGRCPRDLAVSLGLPESPRRRLYPTTERKKVTIVVGVDPASKIG